MRPVHVAFTVCFAAVLIANGLSPYLGVKFEYSMTMFSDLAVDCSNHLFMPRMNLGGYEYFTVEEVRVAEGGRTPELELLLALLEKVGHPAAASSSGDAPGAEEAVEFRPVHGDLIRHHMKRARRRGTEVEFVLTDFASGRREVWRSAELDESELLAGLTMRYPLVLWSYEEIHKVLREFNSQREGGLSSAGRWN